MKVMAVLSFLGLGPMALVANLPNISLGRSATLQALGAAQGIAYSNQKAYLYGDREVGVIRKYQVRHLCTSPGKPQHLPERCPKGCLPPPKR